VKTECEAKIRRREKKDKGIQYVLCRSEDLIYPRIMNQHLSGRSDGLLGYRLGSDVAEKSSAPLSYATGQRVTRRPCWWIIS
jgi:hypothetical protein